MGLGFLAWRKKKMEVRSLITVLASFLSTPQLGVIIISPSQRYYDLEMILTKWILSIERRPSNSSYNVYAKSSISTVSLFNFLTAITTTLGLNLVCQWVLAANQPGCRWMIILTRQRAVELLSLRNSIELKQAFFQAVSWNSCLSTIVILWLKLTKQHIWKIQLWLHKNKYDVITTMKMTMNTYEDKQNAVMTIKRSNITKFQHTPRSDAVSD